MATVSKAILTRGVRGISTASGEDSTNYIFKGNAYFKWFKIAATGKPLCKQTLFSLKQLVNWP